MELIHWVALSAVSHLPQTRGDVGSHVQWSAYKRKLVSTVGTLRRGFRLRNQFDKVCREWGWKVES